MAVREVDISGHKLTIRERDDTHDPSTGRALTGSWLWDSALLLAEWMAAAGLSHLRDHPRAGGLSFLELGAGTGLPGLAAAAVLGARSVVLTDVPQLVPGLRANVEANGLEGRVEVRELRWGSASAADAELGDVDVVLMSDVFFDAEEVEGLARTLRRVWGEGTRGYAATEVRPGVEECLEVLRKEGFEVAEVATAARPLLSSPEESSVFTVYLITRSAATGEDGGC